MQTPAGWYPDPESPSQQRYWDGSQWTEHRAPLTSGAAPVPPAPAPAPAPAPPPAPAAYPPPAPAAAAAPWGAPGGPGMVPPVHAPAMGGPAMSEPIAPAKKSRKGLWIVLGILGVVIIGIVAVVALSGTASESIEEILPAPLEENFSRQGVTVDITKVDCGDVDLEDGPFEVTCTVSFAESSRTLETSVSGTISGSTIRVTDASSEANLVNEEAAVTAVQGLVDRVAKGVEVTGCELPEEVLVLRKGDRFTCEADSGETLEVTATSTKSVEITRVR